MKLRTTFVTNSSSSSFVLLSDKEIESSLGLLEIIDPAREKVYITRDGDEVTSATIAEFIFGLLKPVRPEDVEGVADIICGCTEIPASEALLLPDCVTETCPLLSRNLYLYADWGITVWRERLLRWKEEELVPCLLRLIEHGKLYWFSVSDETPIGSLVENREILSGALYLRCSDHY